MDKYLGLSNKETQKRVTPDRIEELKDGQIFVFGSNPEGRHYGGASWMAARRFGAIDGQGEGLQGQSYAIPTDGIPFAETGHSVKRFIVFADAHPDMTFLVTRIGCGSAGYTDEEIAPLFVWAYCLPNVYFPASFWEVLNYRQTPA